MTTDWWFFGFVTALFLFFCSIGYILYILRRKERYTRERFAFAALTSLSASALTLISEFANRSTPWQVLARLFSSIKGTPPPPPDPPHMADHMLMAAVWFGLLYLVVQVYKGWTGAISERQFDSQRFHRPSSLIVDAILEAKRVALRKQPAALHLAEQSKPNETLLLGNRETRAWHVQARDLLSLKNVSYDFQQGDWHPSAKCWIGRDKQSFRAVAAYCDRDFPTTEKLRDFVTYTKRVVKRGSFRTTDTEYLLVTSGTKGKPDNINFPNFTIKVESEETLLQDLVDFSDYFQSIKYRVEQLRLPDSSLCLCDTYTPTHFISQDVGTSGETETYLQKWLEEKSQRHLAMLGEYGQGKSTTALMFAYSLIARPAAMSRVPVLIELRGKSPKNMTREELLAGWAYPYRIDPQAVMKLHESGKILLILEGFDEIAQVGDPESRLSHFRTLWEFAGYDAKILITGRPNFFLDDTEMKVALGISGSTATGPYCEALSLKPFELNQISAALRKCSPAVRDGIVGMAVRDHKFREVVSRGSLLYVVSQLWETNKLAEHQGPITLLRFWICS